MGRSLKKLLSAAAGLVLCVAAAPVLAGSYGLEPMPEGEAAPIARAVADYKTHSEGRQKFSGRIVEVCQNSGCWMVLENEGVSARVMMHDHKFSIPKDSSGAAVVYGQLSRKDVSAKDREHLQKESTTGAAVAEVEYRIDTFAVELEG